MSERSKFIYQLSRLYNGSFREVAWRLGESWCNWIGLLYTTLLVRHLPRINLFQRLWESHPVKNLEQTRAANGKSGVWLRCFIHRLIHRCIRLALEWCMSDASVNQPVNKTTQPVLEKVGHKMIKCDTAWDRLMATADCRLSDRFY